MYRQEMNVDSNIESTRGTHKIKRVEIIDGKSYYVLDVHSWYEKKNENNLTLLSEFGIILVESERGTLDLSLWMNIDDSSQLRQ